MMKEGAYAMIQGTHPLTLAQGLMDSPAGVAAWLVEKFQSLSDCDGDVETRFAMDELLTNIMVYWTSGTIGSSFLPYYDFTQASVMRWILEKAKEWVGGRTCPPDSRSLPRTPSTRRASGRSAFTTSSVSPKFLEAATSPRWRSRSSSPRTCAPSSARFASPDWPSADRGSCAHRLEAATRVRTTRAGARAWSTA
jgi:hypothetical protein